MASRVQLIFLISILILTQSTSNLVEILILTFRIFKFAFFFLFFLFPPFSIFFCFPLGTKTIEKNLTLPIWIFILPIDLPKPHLQKVWLKFKPFELFTTFPFSDFLGVHFFSFSDIIKNRGKYLSRELYIR